MERVGLKFKPLDRNLYMKKIIQKLTSTAEKIEDKKIINQNRVLIYAYCTVILYYECRYK